jgi:hypothetical protein
MQRRDGRKERRGILDKEGKERRGYVTKKGRRGGDT